MRVTLDEAALPTASMGKFTLRRKLSGHSKTMQKQQETHKVPLQSPPPSLIPHPCLTAILGISTLGPLACASCVALQMRLGTSLYSCFFRFASIYKYVNINISIYIYMYVCVFVYLFISVFIHLFVFCLSGVYTCIYIYTYMSMTKG